MFHHILTAVIVNKSKIMLLVVVTYNVLEFTNPYGLIGVYHVTALNQSQREILPAVR